MNSNSIELPIDVQECFIRFEVCRFIYQGGNYLRFGPDDWYKHDGSNWIPYEEDYVESRLERAYQEPEKYKEEIFSLPPAEKWRCNRCGDDRMGCRCY